MTKNKKKYLAPEMKVVELELADIIATSTTSGGFEGPDPIHSGDPL